MSSAKQGLPGPVIRLCEEKSDKYYCMHITSVTLERFYYANHAYSTACCGCVGKLCDAYCIR